MTVSTMRMGLIGFADEQYLRNLLMTRTRTLQWERWPFMEADALWINGEHAQLLRNQMIRIPSTDPTKKAVLLNLKELDRPAAFTLPVGDGAIEAPVFDPHKTSDVVGVLQRFETALTPLAVELTLASDIAQRRRDLIAPTYHLSLHGRLIAVVNVTGEIGIDPDVVPSDVMHAQWSGRPGGAGEELPRFFRPTTLAVLMWQYAMRSTDTELLPSRYRTGPVYWRRMPSVPGHMVREEHLLVIAQLSAASHTVDSLVTATGLSEAAIVRALAALYFCGSLTTDARKAGPLREIKPREQDDAWPSSMTSAFSPRSTPMPPRPGRPRFDMPTVPTPLDVPKKKQ